MLAGLAVLSSRCADGQDFETSGQDMHVVMMVLTVQMSQFLDEKMTVEYRQVLLGTTGRARAVVDHLCHLREEAQDPPVAMLVVALSGVTQKPGDRQAVWNWGSSSND